MKGNDGIKGVIKLGSTPWNKGKYKPGRDLRVLVRDCHKSIAWRIDCFKKDGYTCQDCGAHGQKLVAHHTKHFETIMRENNITSLSEALHCNELWKLNNGVTLCAGCHRIRHKKEGYRR